MERLSPESWYVVEESSGQIHLVIEPGFVMKLVAAGVNCDVDWSPEVLCGAVSIRGYEKVASGGDQRRCRWCDWKLHRLETAYMEMVV